MIVSGNSRYGIVDVYVLPSDTTTSIHIAAVLDRFPNRKVILVGDLNLDLDSIETDRDMVIADILATSGLLDMHRHFKSARRFRRPATWHQKREGNIIRSRLDYFPCSDRRIIRQYGIRDSHHFVNNHQLVCDTLTSNTLKENKSYLHGRTNFPHQTPKMGLSSKLDNFCHDIEQAALPPVSTPEQKSRRLISKASWWIINQKNALHKLPGPTNQTACRYLNRSLEVSFKEDRKRQEATTGVLSEAELNQGRIREA